MRLKRVTLREIRMPLKERFVISSGSVQERRILLVELEDENRLSSWSECVAPELPYYSPETVDTAWLALERWLVPAAMKQGFPQPFGVGPVLERAAAGHRMAKAALEMGFWALRAEAEKRSLAALIGGTREWVEVGVSLGIEPTPEALATRAVEAAGRGYRRIKLKIKPGSDLEYVASVREALGPDVGLMVDANAAYEPADFRHLKLLDEFELMMIEQPLGRQDLVRHGHLQARIRTSICLDESVDCPDRADDMIALRSGRIINIKPGRVGGFSAALAIHDRCCAARIPVWCGGMLETGIGRAYNVALAALPNFQLPGDLSPSDRYWDEDIVDPAWRMTSEGVMRVPADRPGLGVEVNRDRIEDRTHRHMTFS